jgi:GT2 family glycosyltransferase
MKENKKISVIIPTMNRVDDVIYCISSILESDYKNVEIIVVDNASIDNTIIMLKNKFSKCRNVKLIESKANLGAGGGRNRGAREAEGEYLLFLDSDNVINREMISNLVDFYEGEKDCGMVGPLMLFKENRNIIWLYFADINMYTSQAKYSGTGELNVGQYGEVIKVGHLPNCFMVKKNDFEKIGGFDEKYIIMYEEADLAERIKKLLKKKIYIYSKAITYHNISLSDTNRIGFRSEERAYLTARNRVYFMKKNASSLQFFIFVAIFNPLILIYYEVKLLKNKEYKKALFYLKGDLRGLLSLN